MSNLILQKIFLQNYLIPCGKSKMDSFAFSITKNIAAFSNQSTFPVKMICCIALGSVLSVFCSLNSCAFNLYCYLKKR